MARSVNRGEIWVYRFKSRDKRRPVVVLTRQEVIPLLLTVIVAPITSSRRGAPSEVPLGVDEGLKHDSATNLDHVQTIERARLVTFIGTVGPSKMRQIWPPWQSRPAAHPDLTTILLANSDQFHGRARYTAASLGPPRGDAMCLH